VVRRGHQAAIVEASIKFSSHWPLFKILHLKKNERSSDIFFSDRVIQLGSGTLNNADGFDRDVIEIPENMLSSGDLISDIYGDMMTVDNVLEKSKTAILCPLNEDVDGINCNILKIF